MLAGESCLCGVQLRTDFLPFRIEVRQEVSMDDVTVVITFRWGGGRCFVGEDYYFNNGEGWTAADVSHYFIEKYTAVAELPFSFIQLVFGEPVLYFDKHEPSIFYGDYGIKFAAAEDIAQINTEFSLKGFWFDISVLIHHKISKN